MALDTVLKGYGMDFSLPPKKVFGKMDGDFIEQRQRGLQVISSFVETMQNFICLSSWIIGLGLTYHAHQVRLAGHVMFSTSPFIPFVCLQISEYD